jgi:hypothetical protein
MALRLLAGPYPMKDIDGNYARFFTKPMWFDTLMALAAVALIHKSTGDSIQPGALVQLDGATHVRNPALSAYDRYCHDLQGTGLARVNSYSFGLANRDVHPVTLYPEGAAITDPGPLVNGAYFLADRVLFGTPPPRSRPHGATGTGTLEATIPTQVYGGYGASFSPGPEDGQVFISGQDGAVLYDHINQEVVSWQRKLGFSAAFPIVYSPALGVWLVVKAETSPEVHHTISVYSDEPVPTSLSNPVALGTVGQGGSVEYRTRLLGANSEPCAGVLVDWSCTSPAVVQITQSTTDADGYALTRVALPIGSTGLNFDLTAGVLL